MRGAASRVALCLGLLGGALWPGAAQAQNHALESRLLHERENLSRLREWNRAQRAWLPARVSPQARVLVVHLWATWCKACLPELGLYARMTREWRKDPRVAFLFVSEDATAEAVVRYWGAQPPGQVPDVDPLYANGARLRGPVQDDSLPLTLLLDGRRVVRQVFAGALGVRNTELSAAIRRLLERETEDNHS